MTPSVNPYNSEQQNTYLTNLIQAHNSINPFNHNLAVVWALSLMREGNEMPSIFMLASFAEPIDALEIRPYIDGVLNDLDLKEIEGEEALQYIISYYCAEILAGNRIQNNLRRLIDLYFSYYQQDLGLENLYLLSCAWDDLENGYDNYYYDGVTLDNIESLAKKEAKYWLENN